MTYDVIGTYEDGSEVRLDTYANLQLAQGAIRWQAQPRGEMNWHNDEQTIATVHNNGGRRSYKTIFRIEETQG